MRTHSVDIPARKHFTIIARSHRLSFDGVTRIMGVVNVTPDSFSRDGCLSRTGGSKYALSLALKHIRDGADIIDIGGESSRPGALRITAKEEINRVIPTIQALVKKTTVPISIDTYKPLVAKAALDAGASIVNNIMGTNNPNDNLLKMIKKYDAAVVLMHMRGTPQTMQRNIHYHDLIDEIISALGKSIEKCLEIGIKSDKIILDPGIGFGKTVEHNLEILNRLDDFGVLERPLLIGTSRKSFIGKVLNREVGNRLLGTAATVTTSITRGAHIVRVHDVKAMKEIVLMTDAILNAPNN